MQWQFRHIQCHSRSPILVPIEGRQEKDLSSLMLSPGFASAQKYNMGVGMVTNERTNEVYLPMNRVNNDRLPVKAEAHQSWPPKKQKTTE